MEYRNIGEEDTTYGNIVVEFPETIFVGGIYNITTV